jgi:hypothetical protein
VTASRPMASAADLPFADARRVPAAAAVRATTLARRTLGEAWLDVAALILTHGVESSFGGLPLLEIDLVTLDIASPDANDALIASHASPEWLMWMRANFTDHSRVAELGGARSYASRLYDYAGTGRDQIARIVETLRRELRHDHHLRAVDRRNLHSVRQSAGFLVAVGPPRTGRLCPQHRFRQERFRKPRATRRASAPRRRTPGCAGRAARDDHKVGDDLSDRSRIDGRRARRRGPLRPPGSGLSRRRSCDQHRGPSPGRSEAIDGVKGETAASRFIFGHRRRADPLGFVLWPRSFPHWPVFAPSLNPLLTPTGLIC